MPLLHARLPSPLGAIDVVSDGERLLLLEFADKPERLERSLAARFGRYELIADADPLGMAVRLDAYFAGDPASFTGLLLDGGGNAFERAVWAELCRIPAGTTKSYGSIALALGKPGFQRAVGTANGRNPIAIVVPCHRVIGADGRLVGYGGGVERKRWLLEHEGAIPRSLGLPVPVPATRSRPQNQRRDAP